MPPEFLLETNLLKKNFIYDWPGWSLADNRYGNEFDQSARERMVKGGMQLNGHINKCIHEIGNHILEVGPFFNPLTKFIGDRIASKSVTYLENDPFAIQWLNHQNFPFNFKVQRQDINHLDIASASSFGMFDAVIASQLFNYIDYESFLYIISKIIYQDGLLFVNNVVDYGLPSLFHPKRPESIDKTIMSIESTGFEIISCEIVLTEHQEFQKHNRLLLVAKKK
jgi:hypothetical protein